MIMPHGWDDLSITPVITAAWLVIGVPCYAQVPERSPESLQQALQQRNALVFDFSAAFVETYEGGMLRARLEERGTMLMKKPGRWRFEYLEPEPKLFVSDGDRWYLYLPEDQQGVTGRLPDEREATTSYLFLAGAGDLVSDFTAAFDTVPDPPLNSYVLRLTPTRTEHDFEFLILVIDARTLTIRRLISHDLQGGILTYFLSNLEENLGLSDTPFTFEFPSGTDVNDDPSRSDTLR